MKTDAKKRATPSDSPAEKFFWALTGHPIKVLLGCLLLIAVAAGFAGCGAWQRATGASCRVG